MGKHLVFLTRGHGYSHAAKDLPVINAVRTQAPDVTVSIASYGKGAEYYNSRSVPFTPLDIADDTDQGSNAQRCMFNFLQELQGPNLVVAHEIFYAPLLCRMLKYRCLLVTHWFFSEVGLPEYDRCLSQANGVVLLDFPQAHIVPTQLKVPVHFTGALARTYQFTREQARLVLGLRPDSFVVVGTFGAFIPECLVSETQGMVKTLLNVWATHPATSGCLFLLINPDEVMGDTAIHNNETVKWVGVCKTPELYYCAADVVVASATFTALSELVRNNIPAVGIMAQEDLTARLHARYYVNKGRVFAAPSGIGSEQLWQVIQEAIHANSQRGRPPIDLQWADPMDVASVVLSYL